MGFLADINRPGFIDQARAHPVLADDHVELGPAVNDSEDAFAYCLALLGIGVVFASRSPLTAFSIGWSRKLGDP